MTAKVVSHTLGDKIRVGKYQSRTGFKRHTGHRSSLSEVAIEKVGKKAPARKPAAQAEEKPSAEKKPPARRSPPRASPRRPRRRRR